MGVVSRRYEKMNQLAAEGTESKGKEEKDLTRDKTATRYFKD
jgi:hypothetical protein